VGITQKERNAYFAGLFDGEGCVYIYSTNKTLRSKNKKHVLSVVINNTNPVIIQELLKNFGGYLQYQEAKGNRRALWYWKMSAKKAENFLKIIFPYLIVKKAEVELALEFRKKYGIPRGKEFTKEELKEKEKYKNDLSALKRIVYQDNTNQFIN